MIIYYTWPRITDIVDVYLDKAKSGPFNPHSVGFITALGDDQHALAVTGHPQIQDVDRLEALAEKLRSLMPPRIGRLEAVGLLASVPHSVLSPFFPELPDTGDRILFHVEHVIEGVRTWVQEGDDWIVLSGWKNPLPSIVPAVIYNEGAKA